MKELYKNIFDSITYFITRGRFIKYNGILPKFRKDCHLILSYIHKTNIGDKLYLIPYTPFYDTYLEYIDINLMKSDVASGGDGLGWLQNTLEKELNYLTKQSDVSDIRYNYIKIK